MFEEKITYKIFEQALLGIKDDYGIIYYMTLDALYANNESESTCHFIHMLLEKHEGRLSPIKLSAMIGALIEYSIIKPIPARLLAKIFELIEGRILDEEEEDKGWINKGFYLLKKTRNTEILNDILELPLPPSELPKEYLELFLDLVISFIKIERQSNPYFTEMTEGIRARYKQVISTYDSSNNYKSKFLEYILKCLEEKFETDKKAKIELPETIHKG